MTISLPRVFSSTKRLGLLAAVVAVAAASGCSGGTAKKTTVIGTVTYKGERLQSGILRVTGPEGSFATASIRPDGTFTLTDVVPGEVKVGVMEAPRNSSSSDAKPGTPAAPAKRAAQLPANVRDPEKSGLKYTITPDMRELTIDIK